MKRRAGRDGDDLRPGFPRRNAGASLKPLFQRIAGLDSLWFPPQKCGGLIEASTARGTRAAIPGFPPQKCGGLIEA